MDRECNKCVYSTRDGNCRKWSCEGTKTVEDIRTETFQESIKILRGLDNSIADMFENIVMNAKHYNERK